MFTKLFDKENIQTESEHKEGDLYRVVETFGKTFELRYGFYEENDRISPLCKPVIVYPDFQRNPLYTDEGKPFVTMMQDACNKYKGSVRRTTDTTCSECKYFERGEEWFGVCACPYNRDRKNE